MATSMVLANTGVVPLGSASRLSSGNAFRHQSTALVQMAPVRSRSVGMLLSVRARLSEEKTARREVLVSILAAGAAFNVVGEAMANPFAQAQNQADQAVSGAKNIASDLSGNRGRNGNALDKAKESVDEGLGKNNPFQSSNNNVANSARDAKNAAEDTKNRVENKVSNFGNTPVSQNFENASKNTQRGLGEKVQGIGSNFQKKGNDALKDGQNLVGQAGQTAQNSSRNGQTPDSGNLFGAFKDFNKSAQDKVSDAKKAVEGIVQ